MSSQTSFIISWIVYSSMLFFVSCTSKALDDEQLIVPSFIADVSDTRMTKIIAHRGYWNTKGSAQNSITAIEKAFEIGADGIEFDIWATVDDTVIVCHDPEYAGLTISSSKYEDLIVTPLPNGERIPTFREYLCKLKEFPNMILFIEMKDVESSLLIPKIIQETGIKNKIVYISFHRKACENIIANNPRNHVELLKTGTSPLSPDYLASFGYRGMDYTVKLYRENSFLISDAIKIGFVLSVWIVNDVLDYEWAFSNGFRYVTTDRPDLLVDYTRNKPIYWENNGLLWIN